MMQGRCQYSQNGHWGNVHGSDVCRHQQLRNRSANLFNWENSFLSREGCWDVLCNALCHCSGIYKVKFKVLRVNTVVGYLKLCLLLQVVMEIPYVFVQASYYTVIVYAMMSFQWTAAKFFWFFFVSYFSFLYFTYYGMMTVSISPNHEVAAIFAAAFYSLFNLFSGFFIPRPVSCVPQIRQLLQFLLFSP